MRYFKVLLPIMSALLFVSILSAHADIVLETTSKIFPDELTLNDKEYKSASLLDTFRRVAFNATIPSTALPIRDSIEQARSEVSKMKPLSYEFENKIVTLPPPQLPWDILFDPALFKKKYPWLYEYLYRDKGMPRYAAINKWTKPIKISFGFPNDLYPITPTPPPETAETHTVPAPRYQQRKGADLYEETVINARHSDISANQTILKKVQQAQNISEQEIKKQISILSELTKLDISYVAHTEETPDNLADLRIVFVNDTKSGCGSDWKTPFKRRIMPELKRTGWRCMPSPLHNFEHTSYILNARFRADFEHYLSTAVLFTPESAHQVDGYILPNADNSIGMSFCFITVDHSPEILKGLVRECLVRSLGLTQTPYDNGTALLGHWNDEEQLITMQAKSSMPKAPPDITDIDRFLIKTLYNPQIKPGMTAPDLARLLSEQQQ